MNSKWLCADASGAKRLKNAKRNSSSQSTEAPRAYLGVFTDDPANIGRWLPRPQTPFTPAPRTSPIAKTVDSVGEATADDVACESPPSDLPYDFGQPTIPFNDIGFATF
jgi:hypothetical protein